jgi:hypothetical protein
MYKYMQMQYHWYCATGPLKRDNTLGVIKPKENARKKKTTPKE